MKIPSALDIVWCRFPEREHPNQPGPKQRPALILAIGNNGTLVAAAYGSSQAHSQLRAWHLALDLQRGKVTVFDLSRRAVMPFTPEYFPDKPKLGSWPKARHAELIAAVAAAKAQR